MLRVVVGQDEGGEFKVQKGQILTSSVFWIHNFTLTRYTSQCFVRERKTHG